MPKIEQWARRLMKKLVGIGDDLPRQRLEGTAGARDRVSAVERHARGLEEASGQVVTQESEEEKLENEEVVRLFKKLLRGNHGKYHKWGIWKLGEGENLSGYVVDAALESPSKNLPRRLSLDIKEVVNGKTANKGWVMYFTTSGKLFDISCIRSEGDEVQEPDSFVMFEPMRLFPSEGMGSKFEEQKVLCFKDEILEELQNAELMVSSSAKGFGLFW